MANISDTPSIISEYPQDTIVFSITDEIPVSSDTVRIQVQVATAISDQSEGKTRDNILDALNRFIKADKGKDKNGWNLSRINRSTSNDGIERLEVVATIRVPESEATNLQARAEKINKSGLRLLNPTTDYSIPLGKRETAIRELRIEMIAAAYEQAAEISKKIGRKYRVAKITFDEVQPLGTSNSARPMSMSTYTAPAGSAGSDGMTSTEKIVQTIEIILAASINDKSN